MSVSISQAGSGLPSRIVLHGVEGVGKTSFGAFCPSPIFAMTKTETGLLTLIDNGLVPPVSHFDEIRNWPALIEAIERTNHAGYRTFVLDTLNGAEKLCFDHVCQSKYDGDWEKFIAYARGPDIAANEYWPELLDKLSSLRENSKMMLVLLAHSRIKTFKNPLGEDFDRYSPEMNERTWGHVHKWADIILFANFDVCINKTKGQLKAKAKSSGDRSIYTQRTAAFDAKNRNNLPESISMGKHPGDSWSNFARTIKESKNGASMMPIDMLKPEAKEQKPKENSIPF